jgi:hypothetical protein
VTDLPQHSPLPHHNLTGLSIQAGFAEADMALNDLWLRQIAVGGTTGLLEVDALMSGCLEPTWMQHEALAVALNEYFDETAQPHTVTYRGSPPGASTSSP